MMAKKVADKRKWSGKVEFFDHAQDCFIGTSAASSRMKYLGCGYNSQVFAVTLQCHPRQDGNNSSTATNTTTMAAVIKLRTFPANATDKKKFINGRIGTYKADTDDTVAKQKSLYDRVVLPKRVDDPSRDKIL